MTHQRETIRKGVVSLIETAAIVAAGKVYSNRSLPLWAANLPTINITSDSEESERYDMTGGTSLERILDLVVEATALNVSDENLDDTLDDLAELIEATLGADHTWGGLVTASTLTATEFETDDEGENSTGTIRMTYTAQYHTS